MDIGFLGPLGTYSYEAAISVDQNAKLVPQASLEAVVEAVNSGHVKLAVLPIYNSTNGIVAGSLEALAKNPRNYEICGCIQVAVDHQLYAFCPLARVERVYSHSQVWGQVEQWLQANLKNAKQVTVSSTSAALQEAMKDKQGAAIASKAAGLLERVDPLVPGIADSALNSTTFYVLCRAEAHYNIGIARLNRVVVILDANRTQPSLDDFVLGQWNSKILLERFQAEPAPGEEILGRI